MKLTRHRGHGSGWEAVDVERPHLVDLRGREGHARRDITSMGCCHDGCLLLHELKKMDTERWVEDRMGEKKVTREKMAMKNAISGRRIGRGWKKGSKSERYQRQTRGRDLRWCWWMDSAWKCRESRAEEKKEKKKKPVNLCLVNVPVLAAGSLSPAAETI